MHLVGDARLDLFTAVTMAEDVWKTAHGSGLFFSEHCPSTGKPFATSRPMVGRALMPSVGQIEVSSKTSTKFWFLSGSAVSRVVGLGGPIHMWICRSSMFKRPFKKSRRFYKRAISTNVLGYFFRWL